MLSLPCFLTIRSSSILHLKVKKEKTAFEDLFNVHLCPFHYGTGLKQLDQSAVWEEILLRKIVAFFF